jgi:hypothetical protein
MQELPGGRRFELSVVALAHHARDARDAPATESGARVTVPTRARVEKRAKPFGNRLDLPEFSGAGPKPRELIRAQTVERNRRRRDFGFSNFRRLLARRSQKSEEQRARRTRPFLECGHDSLEGALTKRDPR